MFETVGIILTILVLFQIKHWYVDFVDQTEEEVKYKGVYLDWRGMRHSIKQGLATMLILLFFLPTEFAVFLAMIDFVIHYHTDFVKMHYGNRDIKTKAFWAQLGLDQMVHQLSYLLIVFLILVM